MALIKCKECGHEMSDSAEKCPNCGALNVTPKSKTNKIVLFVLSFLFIVIGAILLLVNDTLTTDNCGIASLVAGVICLVAGIILKGKK